MRSVCQLQQFDAFLDVAPVGGLVRLDVAHDPALMGAELAGLTVEELVIDAPVESAVACVLDPRSGQLLREHLRQQRGHYRIPDQDRPAHTPRTTQQLLLRCARIGAHAGTLAEHMYLEQGVVAIRRIQGLFGLARKHGAAITDDAACARLWLKSRP